jgi:hypothetical protein
LYGETLINRENFDIYNGENFFINYG